MYRYGMCIKIIILGVPRIQKCIPDTSYMRRLPLLRGVFRIKCAGRNNFNTNHFRSLAISGLFKACLMPIRTYRSQQSTYRRKAAADPFLVPIRATPSRFVLRQPWDSERSAGFDFTSLKPKNVRRSRIRRIRRLTNHLDAFAAIKILLLRRRRSPFLRPSTETGPGAMIFVFSAWKSAGT
jgi:hypothetical protein